jgi:hypothetical protein
MHELGGFLDRQDEGINGNGKGFVDVVGLLLGRGLKAVAATLARRCQHTKRLVHLCEQAVYGWCFPSSACTTRTRRPKAVMAAAVSGLQRSGGVVHHHVSALPGQT